MIEIKVPTIGESISEVTLVKWLKKDGEFVNRDEVIAELESEKATFEVNAEQAGVLKTVGKEGDTLNIGDVLAQIDETVKQPESNNKPVAVSENGTEAKQTKSQPSKEKAPEKKENSNTALKEEKKPATQENQQPATSGS